MDKFCYLGDMLSVDGDADVAVENRIWIGWSKFRQLVLLFTNKDIVLDAQTQNGDEPVGEYSFLGQSCLSSADSWWNG